MTGALDPVVEVLRAEAAQLRILAGLLEEEAAALRSGDVRALTAVGARKEKVALELRRLERTRGAAIVPLAAALGVPVATLGLGALIRLLPATSGALAGLRAEIRQAASTVASLTERNRGLLGEALRCLREWTAAMRAPQGEVPTYAATGRRAGSGGLAGVLDRTA